MRRPAYESRLLPVVTDRSERIGRRGRAVGKGDRPNRRLTDGSDVQLKPEISRQRPLVQGRNLHEEIVRMLSVVKRLTTV